MARWRKFRLRKRRDFERVYREGRSWSHPLLILRAHPNGLEHSRFGFVASKRLGKAVVRNRARRLMREATRLRVEKIAPGWDVVLIAREPLLKADFRHIGEALEQLLRRAHLWREAGPSEANGVVSH